MNQKPILGIIGGSGLYGMKDLHAIETVDQTTPFGKPSSPITIGEIGGVIMAFLARHGIGHTLSPTEVNYRANIYALKSLGVKRIVSISACGSLREDYQPGDIVIPDNLVDFTRCRKRTFFEDGIVAHIGTANPYCERLSGWVGDTVLESGGTLHRGGTLITIEGPRFSTRGESNLFRQWGMSIIGMTASPEAFLAREAEICYTTMAHVTDYDVWHVSEEAVSVELVVKTLLKNTEIAQRAIVHLTNRMDLGDDCECHHALKDAIITNPSAIREDVRKRLDILISNYIK
jgi:5'-methylthioadenosine phosphorylase